MCRPDVLTVRDQTAMQSHGSYKDDGSEPKQIITSGGVLNG